jgi:hypothetical protein
VSRKKKGEKMDRYMAWCWVGAAVVWLAALGCTLVQRQAVGEILQSPAFGRLVEDVLGGVRQ